MLLLIQQDKQREVEQELGAEVEISIDHQPLQLNLLPEFQNQLDRDLVPGLDQEHEVEVELLKPLLKTQVKISQGSTNQDSE